MIEYWLVASGYQTWQGNMPSLARTMDQRSRWINGKRPLHPNGL